MRGTRAGLLASGWPRTTVVCLIGLASSILTAFLLVLIKNSFDLVEPLLLGTLGIWLPSIIFFAFQSLIMGGEIMNFKRGLNSFSALTIFMLITAFLGYIVHLLGISIPPHDLLLVGVALMASLNALVNRYMTGKSLAITGTISLAWPLLILITTSPMLGVAPIETKYVEILLTFAFMALPTIVLSKNIDKLGEILVGVSSKKIFRAYAINWFTKAKDDLESFFNLISVNSHVSCDIVTLLGSQGTVRGVIAVPRVHPGPLRGFGSSSLPSDLTSVIKSTCNAKSVVFHGFTTHASDVTSSKDYHRFLELVRKALAQLPYSTMNGPSSHLVRVDVNGLSVGCQLIKGLPLVFVSGNDSGIDDIPETLGERIEKEVEKAYSVKPILINAHNQYERDPQINFEELKNGILRAVDLAFKSSSFDSIKIGIGEAENLGLNEFQGVGPSGIRVLVTEFKGSRYCYVVVDANNASKEFRSSIRSIVESMGYKDCELFTTDSHMVVHLRGVKSSRGYHILGERVKARELLNALKVAIKEAEEDLSEVDVQHRRVEVEARVLGDVAYKNIEKLLTQAVNRFKNLGLIGYSLAMMASFFVCWLL